VNGAPDAMQGSVGGQPRAIVGDAASQVNIVHPSSKSSPLSNEPGLASLVTEGFADGRDTTRPGAKEIHHD
jgi:hypothetical protein